MTNKYEIEKEPLAPEELRSMHGEPVWVEDLQEWAIVTVDTGGTFKDIPFVQGILFCYDTVKRDLKCYKICSRTIIDKSKEGCEFCNNPHNRKLYGFPFCGECGKKLGESK